MLRSFQLNLTPRLLWLDGIPVSSKILVRGQTVWENPAADSEVVGMDTYVWGSAPLPWIMHKLRILLEPSFPRLCVSPQRSVFMNSFLHRKRRCRSVSASALVEFSCPGPALSCDLGSASRFMPFLLMHAWPTQQLCCASLICTQPFLANLPLWLDPMPCLIAMDVGAPGLSPVPS